MAGTPRAPRGRGRAAARPPEPLGSFLGPGGTPYVASCDACDGTDLTRFRITLADGTDVEFVSCQRCEQRAWVTADGERLTLDDVSARSAKP